MVSTGARFGNQPSARSGRLPGRAAPAGGRHAAAMASDRTGREIRPWAGRPRRSRRCSREVRGRGGSTYRDLGPPRGPIGWRTSPTRRAGAWTGWTELALRWAGLPADTWMPGPTPDARTGREAQRDDRGAPRDVSGLAPARLSGDQRTRGGCPLAAPALGASRPRRSRREPDHGARATGACSPAAVRPLLRKNRRRHRTTCGLQRLLETTEAAGQVLRDRGEHRAGATAARGSEAAQEVGDVMMMPTNHQPNTRATLDTRGTGRTVRDRRAA